MAIAAAVMCPAWGVEPDSSTEQASCMNPSGCCWTVVWAYARITAGKGVCLPRPFFIAAAGLPVYLAARRLLPVGVCTARSMPSSSVLLAQEV